MVDWWESRSLQLRVDCRAVPLFGDTPPLRDDRGLLRPAHLAPVLVAAAGLAQGGVARRGAAAGGAG